jgi:hypothetical protein
VHVHSVYLPILSALRFPVYKRRRPSFQVCLLLLSFLLG